MDEEELSPFLDSGSSNGGGSGDGGGRGGVDSDQEEEEVDGLRVYSRDRSKLFSVGFPRHKKTLLFFLLAGVVLLILAAVFSAGITFGHFAIPQSQSSSPDSSGNLPIHNNTHDICSNPPVLLISLDGFWSDYLKRNFTPFINSLAASGVRAEYMRSEFPTKTFPNHFSIVTGLHPETHGIVNNYFYDTILKDKFFIGSPHQNDPKWWLGEPIWVTAVKQGLKAAVYFWPGSEVKIKGVYYPTYFYKYSSTTSYEQRVSTILCWLDLPNTLRPQFIAAYFEEPDKEGHAGGPNSDLVNAALSRVDKTIASLFAGLKERGLERCVNVIIISDHGMTTYNTSKLVHLNPVQDMPTMYTSDEYLGSTYQPMDQLSPFVQPPPPTQPPGFLPGSNLQLGGNMFGSSIFGSTT